MSSARNAGESAIASVPVQPSAEIARVECAKCRRECDLTRATLCGDRARRVRKMQARERYLSGVRATLCGDRACRAREMQARVRLGLRARNPLRRSCVSSARNGGESAICEITAQPSAEIVRVECAKCRRECDLSHARATVWCVSSARNAGESAICPVCAQPSAGDRACRVREMQALATF